MRKELNKERNEYGFSNVEELREKFLFLKNLGIISAIETAVVTRQGLFSKENKSIKSDSTMLDVLDMLGENINSKTGSSKSEEALKIFIPHISYEQDLEKQAARISDVKEILKDSVAKKVLIGYWYTHQDMKWGSAMNQIIHSITNKPYDDEADEKYFIWLYDFIDRINKMPETKQRF